MDTADKKLQSAQGTKRSYKMEIRLLPKGTQRMHYESLLAQHDAALSELSGDLHALRESSSRDQLFLGAKYDKKTDTDKMDSVEAGNAVLKDASRLQDKTQDALDRTKRMVEDSKEIGRVTLEELQRQREKISNIDTEVQRMDDNLARADKLIKTFARRLATDKMFQCFSCCNVLLLIAVVVWAIVKKGNIMGHSVTTDSISTPLGNITVPTGVTR
jgi:SNARE protein